MRVRNILLIGSLGLSAAFVSTLSMAQEPFSTSGNGLTRGKVFSASDINSAFHNPAAPSVMLNGKQGFQTNFIAPFGATYEVGEVDSLIDELDELIDILESDQLSAQDALEAKDRFEPFLKNAARDGMIKLGGSLALPFMPVMYFNNQVGTFYADLRFSGSLRSTVLDDDIDIIAINDNFKINTSASVYVKSAGLVTLGFGYSRPIWEYKGGLLHAGLKLSVNQYELSKNIISLAGLEDGERISDAIQDDYEANANTSANVGIDAGLIWVSSNFNVGLAITDINQAEYDYGSLVASTNECQALSGVSLENCFVAQNAIAQGKINGNEVFIANTQANLSASTWMGDGVRWGFHTSIDLNDKNDAVGDVYQWANIASTVQFDNWFVPEFRFGYTKNLAGTKLAYYSVGITIFKQAELDVRWSDQSVEIDNESAPRSASFSFAIQTKF
jgi:hypothetical protein